MERCIFINGNHRKFSGRVMEGGYSRNVAWEKWLLNNTNRLKDIRLRDGKIFHNIQTYCILLFSRNKVILFLYPLVGVPLFYMNVFEKVLSSVFFICLDYSLKHNRVVFDISDLKYEQAVDLELMNKRAGIRGQEIEKRLFSTKAYFIFASYEMRRYACEKYGINFENTDVCINGGSTLDVQVLENQIDLNEINYVYAGTLNRGRQIEQLIESFPKAPGIHLYLLGTNGEWIKEMQGNITYLGPMEEVKAHYFVSLCDVGLIPYDESRLYYNIAYPTKLSFYITAKIPYISTPVKEVCRVDNDINGGWIESINKWTGLFNKLTKEEIARKKANIEVVSDDFLWDKIFSRNIFIH